MSKYNKDYNKNKEWSYLKDLDVNNFYGCAISQMLLLNDFRWVEDISEFNEDFTKSYNVKMMKDIFLKLIIYLSSLK